MFERAPIVGLDIGTSKVCAVACQVGESGALNLIGLGQSKSRGVRKGEIVDVKMVLEDIRNAIVEAEQMADREVRGVYLGVTGGHIASFNNRGVHRVASHDRQIMEEDMLDAAKNAKAIRLPTENRVVHVVRQHFLVDDQEGIANPVGMVGSKVEVDVHVVHGNINRLQNPVRAVKSLQLEVEDIVFSGLASSLAVLSNRQKEIGTLVIDMGAGTTEYVVYTRGVIRHTGVLAVGGDHVSNDLACGLKIPLGRAEQLKTEHGSAFVDQSVKGQTVSIAGEAALADKNINLEHLRRIMYLRLEETFSLIAQNIDENNLLEMIPEGIVLCGGGANIPGIAELASTIFGVPACVGKTHALGGISSTLDHPEFATAIGLARFGLIDSRRRTGEKPSLAGGIKNTLSQLFKWT